MTRFNANPIILYSFLWQKDESQEFVHFHIIPQVFFFMQNKKNITNHCEYQNISTKFYLKKK